MNVTLCNKCSPRINILGCCRNTVKRTDKFVAFYALSENINLSDYFDDTRDGISIIVGRKHESSIIVKTNMTQNYSSKLLHKNINKITGKRLSSLSLVFNHSISHAIIDLEEHIRNTGKYNGFIATIDDISYLVAGFPICDMVNGRVISVLICKSPNVLTESVTKLFR